VILSKHLAALDRHTTRGRTLTNAAIVLMQKDEPFEMDALERAYDHAIEVLEPARGRKAGAA
jgi:hypothetical protein